MLAYAVMPTRTLRLARPSLVRGALGLLLVSLGLSLPVACGSDEAAPVGQAPLVEKVPGTAAAFALDAHDDAATFFDFPYPSDLRLDADGKPAVAGFPNPFAAKGVSQIIEIARDRRGFSVLPVAYFRFDAPLPDGALSADQVIPAAVTSPIFLVDVDEKGPEQGRLIPVVARVLSADDFTPDNVLAVSPRPGFVLRAARKYAVVVRRDLGDAGGQPLGVSAEMAQIFAGQTPAGPNGERARTTYAPLLATLAQAGVATEALAAATVFTTADVVKELHELSAALVARDSVTIDGLAIDSDGGNDHERYCQLTGSVRYPQYQVGKPPFNTEGLFAPGPDGLPVVQRSELAPIVLTLPKGKMPAGGYPLVMYFHGSGGDSHEVVDLGPKKEIDGEYEKGTGVAYVLSPHGLATAASALPVNPERLPGAEATAYLNISNLPAMRDTFRQGIIEQRMFLAALQKLVIPEAVVAGCGLELPAEGSETAFHYRTGPITAQGLSMGGAYTNMIGAIEPSIGAVVPTGAGGYWTYFITVTSLVNGKGLGPLLFRTGKDFTFQHPLLAMLEQGWETIDPMVFVPRLAAHPLENQPVRSIYEPVAPGDKYFPTVDYDAMALAYENQLAGPPAPSWGDSMSQALQLRDDATVASYPVRGNRTSATGDTYTGAVVQYEGDGIGDPHVICAQLDSVKYQFGCFHASFAETGQATIVAPQPLGTPCATAP
jgi:hypothetical protein